MPPAIPNPLPPIHHHADEAQTGPDTVQVKIESDDEVLFPEVRDLLTPTAPVAGKKRARKGNEPASASSRGGAAQLPATPARAVVPARRRAAPPKAPATKPAGRKPGATGYNDADLTEMLRLVREILPLGPDEWATVVSNFNKWARANNRGERQLKPFRSKWDAVSTSKYHACAETHPFYDLLDCLYAKAHRRCRSPMVCRAGLGNRPPHRRSCQRAAAQ